MVPSSGNVGAAEDVDQTFLKSVERQSAANAIRAETAETRLHEVTQSFAYLIERKSQADKIVKLGERNKLPPLLLVNQIVPGA